MSDESPGPAALTGIVAYDLAPPAQLLLPTWQAFPTEAERARNAAAVRLESALRSVRLGEELQVASGRWREVRAALANARNLVGVAILGLHRPMEGYDSIECSECMTSEDYQATPAPWECATFKTVATAAGVAGVAGVADA